MARALVTGGSGFLGQYLVRNLTEAGFEVSVVDLKPSSFVTNDIARYCRSVTYGVDVTQPETLAGHFDGIDIVYHLAGIISFWRGHADLLRQVNAVGTANVLRAAQQAGVSRFIHVSSVAAIGFDKRGTEATVLDESFAYDFTAATHKPYMLSKHLAERDVLAAVAEGLDGVIVNPGLMWGPGDMVNSSKLICGLNDGKVFAYFSGGTNIVDVRDVATGLVKFATQGKSGERYILGGRNLTFRQVYDVIIATLGIKPPRYTVPRFLKPLIYAGAALYESRAKQPPAVTSDNVDSAFMYRYFSSSKAEREIGWRPEIDFATTISDSVDWLRAQGALA